ncbi:MAG: endonuclease/exonuclease/phosphatase family protein [Planctomycetota bacterium]
MSATTSTARPIHARPGAALVLLATASVLAFATDPQALAPQEVSGGDTRGLRVLVWNIERGANPYTNGAEKALAQIRSLSPDVCLLQESYDIDGERPKLGAWMAKELGWNSWQGDSTHLCVLTPLEIRDRYFHKTWHGVGARLEDRSGRRFDVYSTWIDYRAYTPYALRDDPTIADAELLRCESEGSNRLSQANALLDHLGETGRFDGSVPLLVGGDWNCPSHLDWTEDTARAFRFKRPLDLPVSRRMAAEGFFDTFREVHPDPLRRPGFTWTPMARGTLEAPMPLDRIDRLYRRPATKGDLRLVPVAARVLPDRHEPAELPRAERAFPSDHGAVVIDLEWRSAGR